MKKLYLLLLIVLAACNDIPSDFSVPKWDTDFNLPICSRFYYIDDMVKLDEDVSVDPNNHLYIYQSKQVDDRTSVIKFVDNRIDTTYQNIEMEIANGKGRVGFSFPEGIEIDSCLFFDGNIKLGIKSNSSEEFTAKVTFPTIFDAESKKYSFQKSISPNSQVEQNQNISGFSHSAGTYPNDSLIIEVEILSGNAGNTALLNLEIKDVRFIYLKGFVPTKVISQVKSSKYLPLDNKIKEVNENITLWEPEVIIEANYNTELNLQNIFGTEVQNLQILGKKIDGREKFLENTNGSSNLGNYKLSNGYLFEKINNQNSKLSDFLKFLPDSIVLIGDVLINPENRRGEILRTDSIIVSFQFKVSSYITLENVVLYDTIPLELSQDAIDHIKNGKAAVLTMKLENYTPVTADIKAMFTDISKNLLFTRQYQGKAGFIDSEGFTNNPTVSVTEFTFDEKDLQDLAKSYYLIIESKFNSASAPQRVAIRNNDWLKVTSYIKLKYKVEIEG
ncbi:MAG TPA: hypothetical protein PK762_08585 [Candidatus Kapabacteria bacterium]|nr:hypothetical protein [Candidatus Kapabacteria bacterium]